MKNTRRSNPKKQKKSKMSARSIPTHVEDIEAYRDRTCVDLAAQMNAAGVRETRTGPEVRQMIQHIESTFGRGHIFAISPVGIDLAMQNVIAFREAVTKICPHYFRLFPIMIHHVDDLYEELDLEGAEMMPLIEEMFKHSVDRPEDEGRAEWDEAIQEWKQQQRVAFQTKCQEHYQRWKAQGHADTELFERFPEWVVAVVPNKTT
jgi:hypothetical protein